MNGSPHSLNVVLDTDQYLRLPCTRRGPGRSVSLGPVRGRSVGVGPPLVQLQVHPDLELTIDLVVGNADGQGWEAVLDQHGD